MTSLEIYTAESAPEGSRSTLEGAQKAFGFLPNLLGTLAASPAALKGYTGLSELFGQTSFSASEQQIVLLTVSRLNGCEYCMAAHSTVADMTKVPSGVTEALRSGDRLADPKLEALRRFTESVVENRGWVDDAEVQAFLDAGFGREQILEVLLGVTMKTLSNYTNHIAATPLDSAFQARQWTTEAASVAATA